MVSSLESVELLPGPHLAVDEVAGALLRLAPADGQTACCREWRALARLAGRLRARAAGQPALSLTHSNWSRVSAYADVLSEVAARMWERTQV